MRMRTWMVGVTAATAVLAAACGGDDSSGGGPQAQPGKVNEQTARQSAQTTISASLSAVNGNDGHSAAAQFQSAASQSQGIITPAPAAGTGSTTPSGGPLAAGTCDCTGTSCTFQDCSDDPNVTMNGTLSWTGGTVKCDLTYVLEGSTPLTLHTSCDLTVGATSIDGTLGSSGTVDLGQQGGGYGNYSWTSATTFENVTYSGGGQPTGGSIHVEGTYSIAGQTYAGNADVTFP